MKWYTFSLAIILLNVTFINAQKLSVGLDLGGGISLTGLDNSSHFSYNAGVIAQYKINEIVSFSSGIRFNAKSYEVPLSLDAFQYEKIQVNTFEYLNIPLYIYLNAGRESNFYFIAGLYDNIFLDYRATIDSELLDIEAFNVNKNIIGFSLGIGYKINFSQYSFFLEPHVEKDLIKLSDHEMSDKMNSWMLHFGVMKSF